MNHPDDEMFDDLHEGVESLRAVARAHFIPLSEKAAESVQRLKHAVPHLREELHVWKQRLKDSALMAAQKTDVAVHEHPWFFTIGALGVGLLVGAVLSRLSGGKKSLRPGE